MTPDKHSRRHFLCSMAKMAAVIAGASALPLATPALAAKPGARSLTFEHTHTGKSLRVTYAIGNKYVPEALTSLNSFLRDPYTGAVGRMDPKLFDLLHRLKLTLGGSAPFQIISGYRCPTTNARLRKTGGGGVAKNSLHMAGKAVDIRLPGVSLADLRDAAITCRSGGVGFYPGDGFVHVDTGSVRHW